MPSVRFTAAIDAQGLVPTWPRYSTSGLPLRFSRRRREIHPPHQIGESGVSAQAVEQRVNCEQRQVPESLLVRLFQPLEREIRLAQPDMDRRPRKGGNVL